MSDQIMKELNVLFSNADKSWMIRKRKIDTKILFEIMSKVLINNNGIKHTLAYNSYINKLSNNNISDAAICKARTKCSHTVFDKIKIQLASKFSKFKFIYAVDGSKIQLSDSLSKCGFHTRSPNSKNNLAMISTIFDVHTKIPFNT